MSKLCDIFWRQCVMGHWQYILYVNKILFVPHCMISLCSFIIPVRIQSFFLCFFFGNFWSSEDFIWTMWFFSLKKNKEKRKMISSFLSTVMGSLHRGCLRCLPEDHRLSGSDLNITISPSWHVSQQTGRWRGGQRSPLWPKPHHSTSDWL